MLICIKVLALDPIVYAWHVMKTSRRMTIVLLGMRDDESLYISESYGKQNGRSNAFWMWSIFRGCRQWSVNPFGYWVNDFSFHPLVNPGGRGGRLTLLRWLTRKRPVQVEPRTFCHWAAVTFFVRGHPKRKKSSCIVKSWFVYTDEYWSLEYWKLLFEDSCTVHWSLQI